MSDLRYNTYYKGGKDDNFISGLWIGSEIVKDTVFICCSFNGVDATFEDCAFIDCNNAPTGKNCSEYGFNDNLRLIPQTKIDGAWK
jgi:hypothetical protein